MARLDVQGRFHEVAAEMLATEETYLAPVSRMLIEEATSQGGWSAPVQIRLEPNPEHPGVAEVVVRTVPDDWRREAAAAPSEPTV